MLYIFFKLSIEKVYTSQQKEILKFVRNVCAATHFFPQHLKFMPSCDQQFQYCTILLRLSVARESSEIIVLFFYQTQTARSEKKLNIDIIKIQLRFVQTCLIFAIYRSIDKSYAKHRSYLKRLKIHNNQLKFYSFCGHFTAELGRRVTKVTEKIK